MAPADPLHAHPDTAPEAVELDRLTCVLGARRRVAAVRRRAGHHHLVAVDHAQSDARRDRRARAHAAARRQSPSDARRSAKVASAEAGVAPTRYAESARIPRPSSRSAARSRRRTRLRVTALPTRRLTANPTWGPGPDTGTRRTHTSSRRQTR